MSLISSAPFSNVTTYRHDYTRKNIPRPTKFYPIPDYSNPIVGPQQELVLPYCKLKNIPNYEEKYPDPKKYAEEVAEKYPPTRRYLREPQGGPPDFDVIDSLYADENRTVYMVSYCKRGDYDSKKRREKVTHPLPEGWVVPSTTQRCSYRNPSTMRFGAVPEFIRTIPKTNLSPNLKEREILEVKTGDTIYISDISDTGADIINGKLHGDVNIRPKFDMDELLKAKLIRTE